MNAFLKEWLRNLAIMYLVLAGGVVFFLIFMRIFYPDTGGTFFLLGELIDGLNLWPIIILAAIALPIASTLPRRRRR